MLCPRADPVSKRAAPACRDSPSDSPYSVFTPAGTSAAISAARQSPDPSPAPAHPPYTHSSDRQWAIPPASVPPPQCRARTRSSRRPARHPTRCCNCECPLISACLHFRPDGIVAALIFRLHPRLDFSHPSKSFHAKNLPITRTEYTPSPGIPSPFAAAFLR